jgi:hypothetical protein
MFYRAISIQFHSLKMLTAVTDVAILALPALTTNDSTAGDL